MNSDLEILFFPFMAQGHMLPLVDIACLFAARGARITIFTTPANADIIRPTILSTAINLHIVPFPCAQFGLPEGCENRSHVHSESHRINFFKAIDSLTKPFEAALRHLRPDCVVSDMFLPWTHPLAAALGIPRIVFHGTSYFALCAEHALRIFRGKIVADLPEFFILPGLPHRIEMASAQIFDFNAFVGTPMEFLADTFKEMVEVEKKSFGTVMNSFYELEPEYADLFREAMGRRSWNIGPASLSNLSRSSDRPPSETECLKWLDGHAKGTVVYACFGSTSSFSALQMREIAIGLESSDHPFVWAVGNSSHGWIPEGYEERIGGRGLLIRGWAPQLLILDHASIGGFVTHCGWNSSLEGIAAGLPVVTWPLYAEQFFNEKLLVEVLGIGVAVGSKVNSFDEEKRAVVGEVAVREAVRKVMGIGEDAELRRRRAMELGVMARRAVEKGGSSYRDTEKLMEDLKMDRRRKKEECV